ncbi:MFS general substrate transporter [Nadsonia fulvescens var. elongata DSM 6958]|uniref:MFS general substrate transporter n=1 Tax=Nadsonia fulvescens var. elongata DSM 6958 TaxID=857566 RepID=A0A1E3PCM3_9ASCO|nr:MFS general substrate transporter [Nadsonia fulvescens var. elongata DSM 6958]
MVFLSATQSFVLGDIFGLRKNIGRYVGTLGFADEIVVICMSPLWGTLSDRIGARPVAVVGALAMATSLLVYTEVSSVYPWLLLCRVLFAVGASAATSMITAILAPMSRYNMDLRALITTTMAWRHPMAPIAQAEPEVNHRGKLAGIVGTATGLGAVLAVTVLLPLPTRLDTTPSQPAVALRRTYGVVGALGLLTALIYFWGFASQSPASYSSGDEESNEEEVSPSYLSLLKSGFAVAGTDRAARQAYLGAFVARATTVITAVFIPMTVHSWYIESGKCHVGDSSALKESCRGAYIQAAILSGVINTCALVAAPLWGFAIDHFVGGAHRGLKWSGIMGLLATIGLVLSMCLNNGNITTSWGFISGVMLGVGEIGVMITSMSLCTSGEKSGSQHQSYSGAMAGVYSFSGGMGILVVSIIGGNWFDLWTKGPFVLLMICYVILLVVTFTNS